MLPHECTGEGHCAFKYENSTLRWLRTCQKDWVHTYWSTSGLNERNNLRCVNLPNGFFYVYIRTLIPILHQKAKRGTPHQAKQAVHCIHAIFNNKEVQLAQIFEVGDHLYIVFFVYLLWMSSLLEVTFLCSDPLKMFLHLQPLSRSLNADVPEQLITPLVSLGHISMLAPDQFASPMKSIVANFIVKDLLMNDRVCGNQKMY